MWFLGRTRSIQPLAKSMIQFPPSSNLATRVHGRVAGQTIKPTPPALRLLESAGLLPNHPPHNLADVIDSLHVTKNTVNDTADPPSLPAHELLERPFVPGQDCLDYGQLGVKLLR